MSRHADAGTAAQLHLKAVDGVDVHQTSIVTQGCLELLSDQLHLYTDSTVV